MKMMELEKMVFVVDDDEAMRKSTQLLLSAGGLKSTTFGSADDFLHFYTPDKPGCLIVDLTMPGMGGIELVRQLRRREWHIPTIIVSGTGTIRTAVEGMKLGVVDFLEKPADPDSLLQKVHAALELDERQRRLASDREPIVKRIALLTDREREILQMLVRGQASKQIAAELGIAMKTVENHRANLMHKMGALNSADLTRMAVTGGIE
jgi:two-component system response regulator FixJ